MRIKLHALLTTVAVAMISSCSYSEQPVDNSLQKDDKEPQVYTLQPRSKKLRKHTYRGISGLRALSSGSESMKYPEQYLGRGYKVGDGVIGHPSNLTLPVLNTEALLKDPEFRDLIVSDHVSYAATNIQTTTEMDSQMEQELESKKIKAGFYLNLGLFSIGSRTSYTNTFNSFRVANKTYARGRLSLYWYERLVRLAATDYSLHKVAYAHLSKSFVENLYYNSIPDLLKTYGHLVVTGYYTGGRATNEYLLEAKDGIDTKSWHKNVSSFIGMTFSWAPKGEKKANDTTQNQTTLYIGQRKTDGKDIAFENKISHAYTKTQLYGGAREFAYATPSQDIQKNFVDLTPWFRSLKDEHTHTLIDISDQGLVGIEHMLIETNLKNRLIRTIRNEFPDRQPLKEPFIRIQIGSRRLVERESWKDMPGAYTPRESTRFTSIGVLYTRYGDLVILVDKSFLSRNPLAVDLKGIDPASQIAHIKEMEKIFKEEAEKLGREYGKIFDCEIQVQKGLIPPIFPIEPTSIPSPFVKTFFDFSSTRIYKYKNPRTNICYIYDESTKSAFSYYDDGEDSILDDYGLATWAERLPSKKISIRKLAEQYIVIGL